MSTIAAISTAQGVGGIGIVRLSGEKAAFIADKVFKPFDGVTRLSDLEGYRAKYGRIIYKNKFIDDGVALVFKSPHSYTGEDVVEISCHGGIYLTRCLLRAVLEAGARSAEPGEFTKRAFLNGKIDLSQAESVMDLISAQGERANTAAFQAREGAVSKKIAKIKNQIVDTLAGLSVWADYPEEDIPQIEHGVLKNRLEKTTDAVSEMIQNYDMYKVLKNGVKTAIIGRPNAGKSTLMNCLAGCERSIVTEVPGTTRDVIEETVMLGDVPLLLADTAGLRETEDIVEKIGVEKAKNYINKSDVIVFMIDASSPLCDEDKNLLKLIDKNKTVIVLNKIDLGLKVKPEEILTKSYCVVEMSAASGEGIENLKKSIEKLIGISKFEPSEASVSNERQLEVLSGVYSTLKNAIYELESGVTLDAVTVLLQDAAEILMDFTGENASEEVINKIFSKFCVGK